MEKPFRRCYACKKNINLLEDKYVLIATFNREKSKDHEAFFHFDCWVEYFNKKTLEKAKNIIEPLQARAIALANSPLISSIISQIDAEGLMSMLKTQLNKKDLKSKIKEKLKKDGKKRSKKSKKTL